MFKQTEHLKKFNFNCFTYWNTQANCETIYIALLVPFTFWILTTSMGSVCLQDYVVADSQYEYVCLSFILLRLVAFGVGSCIIMEATVRFVITPLVKQYECTLPGHIRELGCILSSCFLNINGSLLSVAFFLFFHLYRMIDNSYGQI